MGSKQEAQRQQRQHGRGRFERGENVHDDVAGGGAVEAPAVDAARSVKADVIYQDEEDPYFIERRRRQELVELPNGVKVRAVGGRGGRGHPRATSLMHIQDQQRTMLVHHPPLRKAPANAAAASSDAIFDASTYPSDSFLHSAPISHPRQQASLPPLLGASAAAGDSDYIVTQSDIGYYGRAPHQQGGASQDHVQQDSFESCGDQEVYCSIAGAGSSCCSTSTTAQRLQLFEEGPGPQLEEEAASATDGNLFLDREPLPSYMSQNTQTDDEGATTASAVDDLRSARSNMDRSDHLFLRACNRLLGLVVMMGAAYKWANYLAQLHDNQFWFVNIKEVEREISFRTEQGLYYSYFKQLVEAPSLWEGIAQLKSDNVTEHLRTINIFHRFNVHEELFLAAVYRMHDFGLRPILFYTYFVFSLQGLFLAVMFVTAWVLSGTWVAGLVAAAILVCHRLQVTRVEFTVALREHFSLPFIFAQFLTVGLYLDSKPSGVGGRRREKLYLVSVFALTLLFALAWQFAQFVLLLQSLVLFGLAVLQVIDRDKTCKLLLTFLFALVSVWYLQHYQPMVLNSLVCSFIPVAVAVLQANADGANPAGKGKRGVAINLGWAFAKIAASLVAACLLNTVLKYSLGQEDDNHIFRFVKSKFGYVDQTDFETRLYLCLPIFQTIGWFYFWEMSRNLALPLYFAFVGFEVACVALTAFRRWSGKEKAEAGGEGGSRGKKGRDATAAADGVHWAFPYFFDGDLSFVTSRWSRPGLCYHVAQSTVLAVLAVSTLRMKCFWGPYVCVFAGCALSHFDLWRFVLTKLGADRADCRLLVNFVRHLVMFGALGALYVANSKGIYAELENLREFWDPDTVALMEWINSLKLPAGVAFTGSMQLLAGVKLCTGVSLTNHPHFEDKELRQRTKDLYTIYSKSSAESVHETLLRYNASYIILEDSICLASRSNGRCNLPTTMDLANGHIPDDGVLDPPHLVRSAHPRFCDEIRRMGPDFSARFRRAFENKTFRVYKVLPRMGGG